MNLFTRIVCLILIAGAFILLSFGLEASSSGQKDLQKATEAAEAVSGDRFRHYSRTKRGVAIISVSPVSSKFKTSVDRGLTELFERVKQSNLRYQNGLRHREYVVFVAKPDREFNSKKVYSPDIAVGAAQYKGTKYDKGGYIYAAGFVISNSARAFLIADHDRDFERVSRIVGYEGEHLILYHNDRSRYFETRDHSKGGGHPLL